MQKNKNKKQIEIEIVNSDDDKGYFASWLMYGFSVDEYDYNQIIELDYRIIIRIFWYRKS